MDKILNWYRGWGSYLVLPLVIILNLKLVGLVVTFTVATQSAILITILTYMILPIIIGVLIFLGVDGSSVLSAGLWAAYVSLLAIIGVCILFVLL